LWFTSISKIVKFLTDTFGEAKILKDKQANFKDWVGSLFVEFVYKRDDLIPATLKEMLAEAANEIQYDLPEFKCANHRWK